MKKLYTALAALLAVFLFASCADGQSEKVSSGETASPVASAASGTAAGKPVRDREGNAINVPDTLERIISTAPSNTEILLDLGLGDKLVAIDTYSFDVGGVDPSIPQMDFYNPDAEAIIELRPDIIIASGHNKVGGEDPFALLEEAGICVAYIPSSDSIQGICGDIAFLGQLTGTEETAQKLIGDFQAQVEEVRAISQTIPQEARKTVYFEISPAPDLYSFGKGTFLNEFIELVGAENIFSSQEGWLAPSAESILKANPDVILTNVSYVENPIEEIKDREGWGVISAVKNGAVCPIGTNASSRPTHKAVAALWEIARAVYPDYYE